MSDSMTVIEQENNLETVNSSSRIERDKRAAKNSLSMAAAMLLVVVSGLLLVNIYLFFGGLLALSLNLAVGAWKKNNVYVEQKKRNGPFLFLSISAAVFFLAVLGTGAAIFISVNALEENAKIELNKNSVINNHIGEIEEISIALWSTDLPPGDNMMALEVAGKNGSGRVTGEFITTDENTEKFVSGSLTISTGQSYSLFPDEQEKRLAE